MRITEEQTFTFNSVEEASEFVRNVEGDVQYQVFDRAFLPTVGAFGCGGTSYITVSYEEFSQRLHDRGEDLEEGWEEFIEVTVIPSDDLVYVCLN